MSQPATFRRFSARSFVRVRVGAALALLTLTTPGFAYADTAREHFDQGIQFYKSNKLDDALTEFQKAHDLAPKEPTALFWTGFIYLQKRSYQEALQPTLDAVALRPNFADGHINLGNIYDGLKRYGDAAKEFEAAIKLEPNMPRLTDAYYNLGSAYLSLDRKPDAIAAFQKAASLAPNDGYVQDRLGYAYQVTGSWDKAVVAHQSATRLVPANANFWLNLGLAQQHLGTAQSAKYGPTSAVAKTSLDASRDAFAQAMKLAPDDYAIRESYGVALYELGRDEAAITQFKKAAQLNPKAYEPLYNMALAQTRLKHYAAAATAYQSVLQMTPDNLNALQGLGGAQFQSEQYDQAAQTYQKITTLKPTSVAGWTNYSLALQRQGKDAEAASVLEEAFKHVGSGKEAGALRMGLASYYYQKDSGDSLAKARDLFRQATQDDPKNANACNGLGLVAQKERKPAEAIAQFKKAIALDPTFDDGFNNLGVAYESNGDTAQAIANFRKALQLNPNNKLAKENLARMTKTSPAK